MIDLVPILTTLKLAVFTTLILLVLGTLVALWLTNTESKLKNIVEAIVALPIVLPPTVLGFYLLIFLSPDSLLGKIWMHLTNDSLVFTFTGLIIGSVVYSLPFTVQPLQNAFEALPSWSKEMAYTLKASRIDVFFSITLPSSIRGYLIAIVLTFAHTIGEFGVVLMIGGNIPGKTQLLSTAIYEHVERLEYHNAHVLSLIVVLFCFFLIFFLFKFKQRVC